MKYIPDLLHHTLTNLNTALQQRINIIDQEERTGFTPPYTQRLFGAKQIDYFELRISATRLLDQAHQDRSKP
jgi:hypothetical protein